jgi:hypothetical protein
MKRVWIPIILISCGLCLNGIADIIRGYNQTALDRRLNAVEARVDSIKEVIARATLSSLATDKWADKILFNPNGVALWYNYSSLHKNPADTLPAVKPQGGIKLP